ncbi:MAG: ribokinase [Kiloniellales bacterium]
MIVVFGSINIDIALQVDALPQPGETVLGRSMLISPGGKGANQAHAARLAGSEVRLFGCVGRDAFASTALSELRAAGVKLGGIATVSEPTGCATIWLSKGGVSTIVVAPGANWLADQRAVPDEVLSPDTMLVLQQEVPPEQNQQLVVRAKARGARIILNAAPGSAVAPEILSSIDFLVVNEVEIRQVADGLGAEDVADGELPDWLAQRFGMTVMATYGAAGVICRTPSKTIRLPVQPIDPLDTTAAGDTFVGVLASCLDRLSSLESALDFANRAAAICCTRSGAQKAQPTWAEIAGAKAEADQVLS